MSKRIKKCFSNAAEVLHRWANQTQDSAYCKNVYFNGGSVYSYGSHYLLGQHHVLKNGYKLTLINSGYASNTTARHQAIARQACSHLLVLNSSDPLSIQTAIIENHNQLADRWVNLHNAISFYGRFVQIKLFKDISAFNRVCDITGFRSWKIKPSYLAIEDLHNHISVQIKRTERVSARRDEKREAAAKAREQAALKEKQDLMALVPDWKEGRQHHTALMSLRDLVFLRIKNDEIQTSKGASVKLEDAKKAFQALRTGTLKRGDKIGDYTFEKVTKKELIVGCHCIPLKEIETISHVLLA